MRHFEPLRWDERFLANCYNALENCITKPVLLHCVNAKVSALVAQSVSSWGLEVPEKEHVRCALVLTWDPDPSNSGVLIFNVLSSWDLAPPEYMLGFPTWDLGAVVAFCCFPTWDLEAPAKNMFAVRCLPPGVLICSTLGFDF